VCCYRRTREGDMTSTRKDKAFKKGKQTMKSKLGSLNKHLGSLNGRNDSQPSTDHYDARGQGM
jgi:hypothetical protein